MSIEPENIEEVENVLTMTEPRLADSQLTERIIGAAIEVHRNLGPGLLESTYEECLCYELSQLGFSFQRQLELPVRYKSVDLDCGYRLDLVVEGLVVLELKSVSELLPVHSAQLLTYLRLSGKPVGLLINFNVPVLKNGLKRLVNHFSEPQSLSSSPRLSVSAVNNQPPIKQP
jgi:GxxExxY protein